MFIPYLYLKGSEKMGACKQHNTTSTICSQFEVMNFTFILSLQIHSIFSLKKFVQLWQPNLFQIPIQTLKQAKLFMIEEYNSCHSKLASDDMDELTHMTAISIQKSYFWILICQLCSSQLDVPLCPF